MWMVGCFFSAVFLLFSVFGEEKRRRKERERRRDTQEEKEKPAEILRPSMKMKKIRE